MPHVEESLLKFSKKSISNYIPGASHVAIDLIWKCIEPSPSKRITLKEALLHPFFNPPKQVDQ